MDIAELIVKLKADTSDYKKGMGDAKGPAEDLTKSTNGASTALKGIASAASGALILSKVGEVSMTAVNALGRIEKIGAQTETVIKSTGGAAGVTSGQIADLANTIETTTGIEAETVQMGENMLLTFTNIKNGVGEGNDVFNQATNIMNDMSVALGQDCSASAMQLGKALNDPIAGVGALRKVGVALTDAQAEQIKAFVKSGDTMSAQKIILKELNTEFGGSAVAYGETMPGQIAKAGHAFTALAENALKPLIPIITNVAEFVAKLSNWFGSLPGPIQAIVGGGALLIVALVGIGLIIAPLIPLIGSLAAVNLALLGPILLVVAAIAAIIAIIVVCIKYHEEIKAALVTAWNAIKDFFGDIWQGIKDVFWGAVNGIKDFLDGIWTTITGALSTAWNAIKQFFIDWWPLLLIVMTGGVTAIPVLLFKYWGEITEALKTAWGAIMDFFSGIWKKIKDGFWAVVDAIKGAWNTAVDWLKGIPGRILEAIGNMLTLLYEKGKDVIMGIWNGIKWLWDTEVKGWLSIGQKIKDAVGDLGRILYDAGKAIIQGLWNGLKDMWDSVTGWFSGIGSWISDHKGPISYDLQLLVPNGKAIMEGFKSGLVSGMNDVQSLIGGFNADLAIGSASLGVAASSARSAGVSNSTVNNLNIPAINIAGTGMHQGLATGQGIMTKLGYRNLRLAT